MEKSKGQIELESKLQQIPDDKLHEICRNELSRLCKGKSETLRMCIPVNYLDTDVLFAEAFNRLKQLTKANEEIAELKKRNSLPLELTAENGAKTLLIGEFHEKEEWECETCGGDGCKVCDDTGHVTVKLPVSWTTIKSIYKKIVNHYTPKKEGG